MCSCRIDDEVSGQTLRYESLLGHDVSDFIHDTIRLLVVWEKSAQYMCPNEQHFP